MQAAGKDAKLCPGCGATVQKAYGCNHMTCIICQAEFCYICGADIKGNVEGHFVWGCNQYDLGPENAPRNLFLILAGPDFFPPTLRAIRLLVAGYFYLIFGPIVFAFMLIVLPFF